MYDFILFIFPWAAWLFLFGVVFPAIVDVWSYGHPDDKTTIEESGREFPI